MFFCMCINNIIYKFIYNKQNLAFFNHKNNTFRHILCILDFYCYTLIVLDTRLERGDMT